MAGWIPMDADSWYLDRDKIAGPWPRSLVVLDLRFWADKIACSKRPRPSARTLATTWGWNRNATNRLIKNRAAWVDEHREQAGHDRATTVPEASHYRARGVPETSHSAGVEGGQSARTVPPVSHDRATTVPPVSHDRATGEPPPIETHARSPTPSQAPPPTPTPLEAEVSSPPTAVTGQGTPGAEPIPRAELFPAAPKAAAGKLPPLSVEDDAELRELLISIATGHAPDWQAATDRRDELTSKGRLRARPGKPAAPKKSISPAEKRKAAQRIYDAYRAHHPDEPEVPSKSDGRKISSRLTELAQQTKGKRSRYQPEDWATAEQDLLDLVEWIHTAPDASFWQGDNDRNRAFLGITPIFKGDKFSDRLKSMRAWRKAGRPTGDRRPDGRLYTGKGGDVALPPPAPPEKPLLSVADDAELRELQGQFARKAVPFDDWPTISARRKELEARGRLRTALAVQMAQRGGG